MLGGNATAVNQGAWRRRGDFPASEAVHRIAENSIHTFSTASGGKFT